MEIVDMPILKFWIFRQNSEFGHLRSIFPSKGHLWTLRAIFSIKTSIYGPYGPHIFGRKSIFGSYGPYIFLVESPNMDPKSVHFWKSPHIWTLSQSSSGYFINRGKVFFSCFLSPYFINRGGLLIGGMGYVGEKPPSSFDLPI